MRLLANPDDESCLRFKVRFGGDVDSHFSTPFVPQGVPPKGRAAQVRYRLELDRLQTEGVGHDDQIRGDHGKRCHNGVKLP
jgi:hypothetical protein